MRIRFQTGVFEAPTLRAISSSGRVGVLLQQREDVPVQFVERGSHSRLPRQCEHLFPEAALYQEGILI